MNTAEITSHLSLSGLTHRNWVSLYQIDLQPPLTAWRKISSMFSISRIPALLLAMVSKKVLNGLMPIFIESISCQLTDCEEYLDRR